jgi:hypothetical protein
LGYGVLYHFTKQISYIPGQSFVIVEETKVPEKTELSQVTDKL